MGFAGDGRRVLIVVQNLPVPFDRRVWLEATTLQRAGYTVSVISPKSDDWCASFEEIEGVHVYRYSIPLEARGALGFLIEFVWALARVVMKTARVAWSGRGFDILHVCNPPETYWPLGWAVQRLGKRFIFDHHDLSPEMYSVKFDREGGVVHALLLWFERMTFRTADVVITTNQSHRRVAIERGKLASERVHVVRSGPDLGRLTRYERDPAWKRGREHLLVYLGEICKQDGVDHLVRAIKILRHRGRNDFHCVLVGGGPYQADIRSYASEVGVDDICTFVGRVSDDDLCRILSSADVAVDPDPKNEWSDKSTMNKIMEYMYFGLPIAAYDLAEARVSAQKAASYAKPNDEESLATVISDLLDDSQGRRAMAEYGIRRLEQELAWSHSQPVLLGAYEQARNHG